MIACHIDDNYDYMAVLREADQQREDGHVDDCD